MDGEYEVVNNYRNYDSRLSFTLVLWAGSLEERRVADALTTPLSQGLLFIGDRIRIVAESEDGIVFEALAQEGDGSSDVAGREEDSLLYAERFGRRQRYLPFLCDILPYNAARMECVAATPVYRDGVFQGRYEIGGIEVTNIRKPLPARFVAKVCQKTRINMYPNSYNPFFFVIAQSNNTMLKIVFWRESLRRYSSLQAGDILYIQEHKPKRKLPFIERMEYNTFTESVYFDCEEVTARSVVLVDAARRGSIPHLFDTVEGTVSYLSVLMRYNCNSCMMEYVLCRIGGRCVVLFYNSDDAFARISPGCSIRITELRLATRAGFEFYVSTIYTQFEILDGPAVEIKDYLEQDAIVQFNINAQPPQSTRKSCEAADSMHTPEASTAPDGAEAAHVLDAGLGSGSGLYSEDYTGLESESHCKEGKVEKRTKLSESSGETHAGGVRCKKAHVSTIFGAVGFIPDFFSSTTEILESDTTEQIHGRSVTTNLFMKPHIATIQEITGASLVLNETKKFIVQSQLVSITEDGLSIDYLEEGKPRRQTAIRIELEHNFACYAFHNFFSASSPFTAVYLNALVGQRLFFVVECIRADIDTVLYYATGIINK